MTPEGFIERLERIVNAGSTRNAEQFIAKHGPAMEPLLTPDQAAIVTALTERMRRIVAAEVAPVAVGTSGTNPLPLAEAAARKITVYGDAEPKTIEQMARCVAMDEAVAGVLCADAHYGYSQPVGGVAAYREYISPSGVGFDISCGLKGVRTDLVYTDIERDVPKIVDAIATTVSFGIGRKNPHPVDHALFDDPAWGVHPGVRKLKDLARGQLGTVGSGNHFVDLLVEPATGAIWVSTHFGSRGFGHRTATGFLNLAAGRKFDEKHPGEKMDAPPTLIPMQTDLGQAYFAAMNLAGQYAYAGRDYVVQQALNILGARETFAVHNHHNFAWREEHNGEELYVVRKGATPCAPGQLGFVGGSMADISVVIRGKETEEAKRSLYSTVHGAGRIMSRTQAAGRMNYRTGTRSGGAISPEQMRQVVREYGVELRGAGTDESPFVYRKLETVLAAHAETIDILHVLKPIGVVMAGEGEVDPYKD
jgi:tRNA-splicing ligase RtcB (3'-phosphate/5'-hydroxy nucleic acid ligase)